MPARKLAIRSAIAASVAGLLSSTAALATDFNGTATATISTGVTITEAYMLTFGTLGITSPTQLGSITKVTAAPADGKITSNNTTDIIVISDGTPLELVISGAPPNAALTFTDVAGGTTLVGTGSNSAITLQNFVADIPLVSDSNGNLNVRFGAEIVFGNDSTYGAGSYTGAYTISLTF